MDEIAISVKNLSKKYHLYESPQHRLREALHPFRKKYHRDFWALRDVSFEVKKGDSIGIIGKNGSGKSTLLQILCGVLQPTCGEIIVKGKVSALLELGAGFNPAFTGRQNVHMNGALLGFSRDEIEDKFPAIAEFADIGEFIDQPVKTYSSGMYVRLAFAVAINVEPDILVVDEALSVGDIFFQQKCFARTREIISSGITLLFVSHDTQAIMNICNQAILMDDGLIDFEGPPEETVSRYFSATGKKRPIIKSFELPESDNRHDADELISPKDILDHNILRQDNKRHGAGGLQIIAARVVDSHGRDTFQVTMLEPLHFYILLKANEDVYDPSSGIHLYDRLGNLVFASGTRQLKYGLPSLRSGQELIVKMELSFKVQPGEYTFSLGVGEPSTEGPNTGYLHDRHEMLGPITVSSGEEEILPFYGIAQLPLSIIVGKPRREAMG